MDKDKNISNEQEELKKLAPNLFKAKRESGFKVPEGYFDEFPTLMQDRILAENSNKGTELIAKLRWVLLRIAFPTAIAVIAVIMGIKVTSDNTIPEENLTAEEINTVFQEEDNYFMDEEMILETLMDEEEAMTALDALSGMDGENEEEIIDYLMDNDIDVSSIVNEL